MKVKNKQNVVSFVFIAFIGIIFALYIILPKKEYSSMEKRNLSAMPKFSLENLFSGDFTEEFDSYMSDSTPFRTFFVGLNSYYNLTLGNNGSNGVYLGKNNMLIEKPSERENQLDRNISKIRSFADITPQKVYLAVAPSKGYVYSENLPANSLNFYDNEYIEKIKEGLNGSAEVIDLSKSLLTEKKNSDKLLYYNTDHHWTTFGAYTAYKQICNSLSIEYRGEDSYEVETVTGFKGTSYSTSAYYFTKDEQIEIWKNKFTKGNAQVTITEGNDSKTYDNMFFYDNLDGDDKYTVFLDGNHSLLTIHNDNAQKGSLLVIKDSFAHCLVPFLSDNYSDITMVDLRYYKKPLADCIKNNNVDTVLLLYSMDNLVESTDIVFN